MSISNKHWILLSQPFALLALVVLAGLLPARAQTPFRIKLGTQAPRGSSLHQILQTMGEKWRQAPGGGIALTIYPDGTLGGEADMVRKMRIGQIQAGMLTVVGLAEIEESVSALQNMPMMFRSLEEVDYVREKMRPELERRLLEKGYVALFWGDAGWVRFFSRDPFTQPAELKKMKLFVWAGDNAQIDIMKAAGYQPVPLEVNDLRTSLQTGMINAVPNVPFYALKAQLYDSAPHMLELNWAPLVGGTVVTRKVWETIPPDTRTLLMKSAAEAGEQVKVRMRIESHEAVEAMKKHGLQVQPVSPQLAEEWRRTAEEFYPQIRGRIVPAPMFDEVRRLLEGYRASIKK
jgi:TRAP-type C4-dicarboxylate transport system substrate-binding protein